MGVSLLARLHKEGSFRLDPNLLKCQIFSPTAFPPQEYNLGVPAECGETALLLACFSPTSVLIKKGRESSQAVYAFRASWKRKRPLPLAHLLQMAYIRLTVEMRKGSFLERVRLLLRVPRPRRW